MAHLAAIAGVLTLTLAAAAFATVRASVGGTQHGPKVPVVAVFSTSEGRPRSQGHALLRELNSAQSGHGVEVLG